MSAFNPANPSAQVNVLTVPVQNFGISSDSGMVDVTGFRQMTLGVNVPIANPAGTTIGVDELRADGYWYVVFPQTPITAAGQNRFYINQTAATIRVRWVITGMPTQFGYSLIGQS